ncbi:MAG TPA: pitrilysin family protein [Candidatus Hydrogenedentes bacterium]|nr:MAG: Peptidase M16 inactive domain protein [Candidatus Hydrogenedentes bacterium ADurb.Bin101]HOC67464.1 pitrilysin family protein [Candidatus Hydrogenedentota bacterium]HQN00202.1 pitrilysin family protein [Candidatus Hydrogenedentota bacterium]
MNDLPHADIKLHRLDNGFTIAMERLPYVHSATAGVWIKTGSAAETPGQAGLAHFLEHLFFKGTRNRTVHQIMDDIERRGGYINAGTSREYTNLYVRMLEEYVEEGLDVLFDILNNSRFQDIEKERGVILEEIASVEDTPDELSHDLLSEYHWPDHPLGRPVSGYAETVATFRTKDFRSFYDTWYTPSNMVFSIAGKFDEEKVLRKVETAMCKKKNAPAPAMSNQPRFQSGVKIAERPISQTHIGLAFPGPSATDDDRFKCNMLTGALGGGGTARLFEIIREKEGLAYSVYAYHTSHIHTGMMGIYEAVAPQNCERALSLTFEEIRRIREHPMEEEELECVRQQLKGSILMAMEGTQTRMAYMAKGLLFQNRIPPVPEIIANINAVTVENLQEYAGRSLTRDSCALLLLGPAGTEAVNGIEL